MDKLTELELELHPWDIDVNTWSHCRGSMPGAVSLKILL